MLIFYQCYSCISLIRKNMLKKRKITVYPENKVDHAAEIQI